MARQRFSRLSARLVERTNLALQTRDRLVSRGILRKDIGIVADGDREADRPIVIANVQSAEHLEDALSDFNVVICDEVHHAKARTYIKLLKKLKNAPYRFGLSGTLFTKDEEANWFRMSYLGEPVYQLRTEVLVEKKVISKPIIRFIEIHQPRLPFLQNAEYQPAYKIGIAENFHRNAVIVSLARNLRGKTLILFKLLDHGAILREMLPRAIYVDGSTSIPEREKRLKAFKAADEAVMLASTIFDEGIDIPHLHNLIIGSGDKSIIKVIQRLGRGLRKNDTGKVMVFDFMDYTNEHLEKHLLSSE